MEKIYFRRLKMKKFFEEFKTFALKGNVMDLAVGVIIGAAFQNIVTALTGSFINPLIAVVTGGVGHDADGNPVYLGGQFSVNGVVFDYGAFASAVINFIIMAFILFVLIKAVNKLMAVGKKPETPAAPTTKKCDYCCSEIAIGAKRCPSCTTVLDPEFQKALNEAAK